MFGGHHHRRHHSAPSTPFLGSGGGGITPRELAVDAATFAGTEALLHQYENRHNDQHHPVRDAAIAGAAAFGVQKLQNYFDQPQMGYPMQQYQYQQPYANPYNYYGGYGANPYGGYGGGYGGNYNVYNGYNTYNMYGGDMYQNPYMPYPQHYHRRHFGGLFNNNPYEREFQPRYSIMAPGQMNWRMGMQQPYY